jgi:hypothetical protein
VPRDNQLRSLERERMYTIFAPLDPEERLPRELLQERRRLGFFAIPLGRTLGRRELAGALWLPTFAGVLVLASWVNITGPIVLGFIALLLAGFVLFAMSGGRKSPLK